MKFLVTSLICFLCLNLNAQDDVQKLLETARTFTRQGDYTNAVLVLNRAAALKPGDLTIEKDIAYNNGMDDFKRISHVPVFVANMDVGHGGTYGQPHGGEFAKLATAWYQWQLKGDKEAAKLFTGNKPGLAGNTNWKFEKKNMP